MDFTIDNELQETLSNDERLLWSARPRAGIIFRTTDIFLIPFSLLWFGFAVFWEYNAFKMGGGLFALFGLPFIIMGLYISIGRFFIDAWKRKQTLYGITGNRIIIKSGLFNRDVQSINIRTLSNLSFKEKANGTGTITLGATDFRYAMFSGMGYWPGIKQPPSLEFINDVKTVYNLIITQQNKNLA